MKGKWTALFAGIAMFVLILDAKTGIAGATEGINLCMQVVIPSLFPFFVISILLNSTLLGRRISIMRPIRQLLRIPAGAEGLIAVGLLGGYPVGAQSISQACQNKQLHPDTGKRMMAFCSNAGPAFIFGMGTRLFPNVWMCFLLWGIHILSAWIVGILTPGKQLSNSNIVMTKPLRLQQAMKKAISAMAGVCGWVILFRVLLAFSNRWFMWALPDTIQLWLQGILEISNCCCSLMKTESIGLRMVIFSGSLGFGGLCVAMQTYSVCDGVEIGWYLPGKVTQGAISVLFTTLAQSVLQMDDRWYPSGILIVLCCAVVLGYTIRRIKFQKRSSIPAAIGV